ncbi:hypothetical protein GEV33_000742 [Tenebrio molitor]|uniref:Uncharacterized protein n=1 Tax=Tenebrio molitor TaxID=7067 RepID=A0A8J6HWL4_TENMO|nr:hypothetical protein GEV33_000742 [Tenebrio molitor]
MLEWEEGDRFSFEDSDRFEEDSLCSWSSEPESLCNNWRGWKKPAAGAGTFWGGGRRPADENEVRFTRTNDKAVFLIRDVGMFLFSNLVGISGWKIRLKSFIGIFLIGIIEVRLVDGW